MWRVAAVGLALPLAAAAHHETGVTRVEGPMPGDPGVAAVDIDAPRVELDFGVDLARFGKVLRGGERLAGTAGQVALTTAAPSAAVWIDDATRFSLDLPFGAVSRRGPDGWETHLGAGDLSIGALRRHSVGAGDRPASIYGEARITLPTGAYARHASVTADDVTGGPNGELLLTTYDTRASLGAGATRAAVRGGLAAPIGARLSALVGAGALTPLHATPDGVRWGTDLVATAGGQLTSARGLTVGRLEVDARHHTPDGTTLAEAGETASGRRVGARTAIGASIAAMHRLGERTSCVALIRAPVWQRVQGVQLAETWSGTVRCTVAWGLRRGAGG